MEWITPKTDWDRATPFTPTDYNRIRNNLLYLNNMINELLPDKAKTIDLGEEVNYASRYYPSMFNAFEDAIDSFIERTGYPLALGVRGYYEGNGAFIDYKQLNRIESICLRFYTYEPPVAVVKIEQDKLNLTVGDTQQLTPVIEPSEAEYTIEWSSSDDSIMTVDENGLVTAVGEGKAKITLTVTQDGKQKEAYIIGEISDKYFPITSVIKYYPVWHNNNLYALASANNETPEIWLVKWVNGKWKYISNTKDIKGYGFIPLNYNGRLLAVNNRGIWEWDDEEWTKIADIPSDYASFSSSATPVVNGNEIHFINGDGFKKYVVWDGYELSIKKNVDMIPSIKSQPTSLNNVIYYPFYFSSRGTVTKRFIYEIDGNNYKKLKYNEPMLFDPYHASLVVFYNELHFLGDTDLSTYNKTYHYIFDLSTHTFIKQDELLPFDKLRNCNSYEAIATQNGIYFIDNSSETKQPYVYDGTSWSELE